MEKKDSNVLVIIIVILLLLVIGLGGYIVYDKGFFKLDSNELESKNKKEVEEKEEKEVALTDSEKNEISTKISQILMGGRISNYTTKEDEKFSGNLIVNNILQTANVSDYNKALVALSLANGTSVTVERTQKSASEVKKIYKNYFGVDWKDIDLDPVSLCPHYSYDAGGDIFYEDSACGGTTSIGIILHKENYILKGDTATVDIYVATSIPKDYMTSASPYYISSELDPRSDNLDMNQIIDTVDSNNYESFTINDTNKNKLNSYKFTFKKSDDNTFYFVSLKKN